MIDFQEELFTLPSVYESARLNDNVDGTGGITISWNADTYEVLPVGASVHFKGVKYSLLEPYAPSDASKIHVRYEPTFLHPLARLTRVPFYITSREVGGNTVDLYTSSFTGLPRTIAQKLCDFMTEYGEIDSEFKQTFLTDGNGNTLNWNPILNISNANSAITVDFDGCSIKAAASRIADALGCNVFFDWNAHAIRFIAGSTISGEYYNCFRVLGGTTNMAKRTLSGLYAPVTQRLMLKTGESTGDDKISIEDGSIMVYGSPSIRLTTDLILDDIYPKLELYISDTHERRCYLTDENGARIPDTYTTVNGEQVVATYKEYSKWYVKLEYYDKTAYYFEQAMQIQDKPLCLLFQPDYTNTVVDCPLAGRQFEVVYFDNVAGVQEWEEDDVVPSDNAWPVPRGWFRLIFTSEGDTILPGIDLGNGAGIIPKIGNKVTLVNIALENGQTDYKAIAQTQLKNAAIEVVRMMVDDKPDYTGTVIAANENSLPMLGETYSFDNDITGTHHEGVVTNVNADLDTLVAEVTVGSWRRKTLTGGMRDKIDSISISKTDGDTTTNNTEAGISKTQFDALWKTTKKPSIDTTVIDTMGADIEEIKRQNDAKFDIIYGMGTPTLSNEPARTWIAEGTEAEHVQDIYYDINRAAASSGGRGWRWMFFEAGSTMTVYVNGQPTTRTFSSDTYEWEEILDLDTRASLEKIRDVADDGILSAGSEKSRIYIEWKNAAEMYHQTKLSATEAGMSTSDLDTAYLNLWKMLDAYDPTHTGTPSGYVYNTTPEWLTDLSTDTVLSDDNWTAAQYRARWDAFYTALAELNGEQMNVIASKISYFISPTVPSLPYSTGDLWLQGDTLYMCTADQITGTMSDWTPVTSQIGVSITNILAEIVVALEDNLNDIITGSKTYATAYMQDTQPSSYDIWFNTSNPVSLTVDGVTISDSHIVSLFMEAYRVLGDGSFRIFKGTMPTSANKFDLYMQRSSFHDNFTNRTVDGSLGVWVYSEEGWVKILDDATGIIQNYGDAIIAAVFGSDTSGNRTASGLVSKRDFSSVFASAMDSAGNTTELAALKTLIVFDSNGNPTGVIKLDASKIDFNSKTIDMRGATSINISTPNLILDADKINWKGASVSSPMEVITNGEGSSKVTKFSVDNEGNVTMNNATMNSASVTGRIRASSLAIQEDAIIPSLFSEGVVSRKDGVYTKILAGKFEMGIYTIDSNNAITETPKYRTSIVDGKPLIEYLDDNGNVVNGITGDNTVIIEAESHDTTPIVIKSVANSWNSETYNEIDSSVNNPEDISMTRWLILSMNVFYKFTEGYVVTRTGETETKTYNESGGTSASSDDGKWFVNNELTADLVAKNTTKYYAGDFANSYTYWKTEDGVTYECRVDSRSLYRASDGVITYIKTVSTESRTGRTRDGSDSRWLDDGGEVIVP